jgi:NADH-quinone oxidoreductase subunit G
MNGALLKSLEVAPGQPVLVRQGNGEARLEAALDDKLPEGCVRVAAGHPSTAGLGAMFGSLSVARIEMEQAA